MKFFHNPRCTKSRQALTLLQERGVEVEVVKYLENIPTVQELQEVLSFLNIPAAKLVRKTEAVYKENYKGKELSEQEWIEAMIENPKLIERPIIIKGNKAVIGRPTEKVLELL